MKMLKSIRIVVPAFVLVVALMLATTAVALGNGGPHEGTFTTLSDSCAGCHRAHTATGAKLLKMNTQYLLCMSCHDGTGANTKETTGVYVGTTNGTTNAGLRGGGFESNLLNTALNATWVATGTPAPVTSRHSVNSTSTIAWGSGAVGNTSSGVGETLGAALTCGNCHNPHGNSNFRMLKDKPSALANFAALGLVSVTDNLSGNYTIVYTTNFSRNVTGAYSGNSSSGIGNWCAQCHTKYLAVAGAGSTNSSASSFNYRHMTDGLSAECFACHMAHSTSANMTGWAGNTSLAWPDNSTAVAWNTAAGESQYSRLLNINNRGVCLQCHTSATLTGG